MPLSQDDSTAAPGAELSPEPGPPDDVTPLSGDAPLDDLVIKRLHLRLSRRRLLKLTNGACLLLTGGALGRLIYIFDYHPARYICQRTI